VALCHRNGCTRRLGGMVVSVLVTGTNDSSLAKAMDF
jgi:hypothetical protein